SMPSSSEGAPAERSLFSSTMHGSNLSSTLRWLVCISGSMLSSPRAGRSMRVVDVISGLSLPTRTAMRAWRRASSRVGTFCTQTAFEVRHAIEEAVLEIGERAGKRSGEMGNHRIELGGCPNADCNGSMASLSGKKMGRRSAPRATEEKARPNLRLLGLLHSFA